MKGAQLKKKYRFEKEICIKEFPLYTPGIRGVFLWKTGWGFRAVLRCDKCEECMGERTVSGDFKKLSFSEYCGDCRQDRKCKLYMEPGLRDMIDGMSSGEMIHIRPTWLKVKGR